MPLRRDIRKVLVIGSGPIIIGQACEFDYSGTQAIKALKEDGLEVVLLNSNPATIMTDPELAHRTYVEPIDLEAATQVIERERPDALLPTMGGQTALNLALDLHRAGVLQKFGVHLIGASVEAIEKAEDRLLFKQAMERIGLHLARSEYVHTLAEAHAAARRIGYPIVVRPSFTLAGTGGGIARDPQQLEAICTEGLRASANATLLIEESLIGWKEFELEVVRDRADNAIIVCSIENFDPMGVHTGDSITVAPAQTLTDKEHQRLRNAALAIIREIGVETGGSNVQFAVNPADGRVVVIEMNPRVSRSSALASKATGYPIARIAAKLAIGYTLDELRNDITRDTPASFEPTLDYVVVKVPRFNFEKFRGAERTLTTSMRSVGEVMAIGRSFEEAFLKALRSIELGRTAFKEATFEALDEAALASAVAMPTADRPWAVLEALRRGQSPAKLTELSAIDVWFFERLKLVADEVRALEATGELAAVNALRLSALKRLGLSDKDIARAAKATEAEVRAARRTHKLKPCYKRVDTCAAEFESFTPFLYSTWEPEDELPQPSGRPAVMILGSGPIRIGQGIEFDYCCVQTSYALRDAGFDTVMVNCNPETVSTDFDTSTRLYFEPLTVEDVLAIAEREQPIGVIVQCGGQTPLRIALELEAAGLPILGTLPDAIDRAEDRERFAEVIDTLGLRQAENGMARSAAEAFRVADRIGYPVMVRPSYVLGGRAMEVVYAREDLERYMHEAVMASPEHPVLIDRFLQAAIEVDVDLVADRAGDVLVAGMLEHVEEAGVHSGDAASILPPHTLPRFVQDELEEQAVQLARSLGVVGLMNVQFAVQGRDIFVLEANPRASRTVPFISKATGVPLARLAARCMVGDTLELLGAKVVPMSHVAVKESVFPFARFAGVDVLLGPEMRSTGEVMGLGPTPEIAFAKSQLAAGCRLPLKGRAFITVRDEDKQPLLESARELVRLGFELHATSGTAQYLRSANVPVREVNRVGAASPNVVDLIREGSVQLLLNTTSDRKAIADSYLMRREALMRSIPFFTTAPSIRMAVAAIAELAKGRTSVTPLQELLKS